jgi:hypothetical protein
VPYMHRISLGIVGFERKAEKRSKRQTKEKVDSGKTKCGG